MENNIKKVSFNLIPRYKYINNNLDKNDNLKINKKIILSKL